MEHTLDLLKDCNIKLDTLATKDNRFVAWIAFSVPLKSFIAGVDAISNDEQNVSMLIEKVAHRYPGEAMIQILDKISEWYIQGSVPIDELFT